MIFEFIVASKVNLHGWTSVASQQVKCSFACVNVNNYVLFKMYFLFVIKLL